MHGWHKSLLIGLAILAATASADAHRGGMGGRASGFHDGFHGSHGFHSPGFLFHLHHHGFGAPFPRSRFGSTRFEGWSGGPYSAGVADFDYGGDSDFAPEDLHFRVQESFGPGDIGRPTPPPERYDNGPGDAARMDPWHGYDHADNW